MAISLLAANNAQSVLAAGIGAAATTLTVNTGTGVLFPSPVPGTSFFKLTLIDAATGTLTEIVHVTQRVGDQMTIERGQEGTVARIWSANDLVANMMTAGTLSYLKQDIDGKLAKTGTSAAASKLATARTIGGVSFDGTANINLPGVNAAGNQSTTGNAATATRLATARAIGGVSFDGTANINLPGVNAAGNQSTTGNAATATKLATARTINGVAFDGTANITLTPKNLGLVGIVETGSDTGYYWRKYSDGKIEIFGRLDSTIGAPLNVVFPKAFTEIPFLFMKENGGAETNGWVMRARNLSKTAFSVQWNLWSDSGQGGAIDVCYHAIGS